MQRSADMVRFCNGKSFCLMPMKIRNLVGIVRSSRHLGGADRINAPSLSMVDKKEGSWREQKVEVCFS